MGVAELKTVTRENFRRDLAILLRQVAHGQERITITLNGKPVAALISCEDLALLQRGAPTEVTRKTAEASVHAALSARGAQPTVAELLRERRRSNPSNAIPVTSAGSAEKKK
ncbi:MAG: type II toxin-antitoxin system Phd/YefM family antitoxin [Candidatus Eremiobacteraeota bacterium]|nr:type II toxin-antitoxin system Phd/YefM family antitoxin [Candidatus Eremiobacteraeota bacterium]